MEFEVARNFLTALLIGALVGIEREKRRRTDRSPTLGGIRTHMLLALGGAASAWLSLHAGLPFAFPAALLAAAGAVIVSGWRMRAPAEDAPGLTGQAAAIVVFLLGAIAAIGELALAAALGVATSAVLAFRQPLHGLVERIGSDDLLAGIKLLVATFVVLPLLPDRAVDPWQAINPYRLWLLVILISALSLVGYVLVRWLGHARGIVLTGLAGGLVSSTAATLDLARRTRSPAAAEPHAAAALAGAMLVAWSVMVLRLAVVLAVVDRALLVACAPALGAVGAVTVAFALAAVRAGLQAAEPPPDPRRPVANPFSLTAAIRFGALFAAVLLAVQLLRRHAPGIDLVAVAALAGSVDVDAITLSLAESLPRSPAAAAAVVAAIGANTVVKTALVLAIGRGPARRRIAPAGAAIAVAGLAGVLLLRP